ncbi:MAG: hypothetical protein EXX96DRAFT_383393 [Benjaminiella poitrasii]|nr:MAG: hypothetical protein EXX96DRAFT_383393 [Benjaminiella poitrasii]
MQSDVLYKLGPQPETMEVDQQTETISANDATTSSLVCSSCGQEDHLRATSRLCANTKHSNTHNMDRKSTLSFTERHNLGGMHNICRHCQARMWALEKNGCTIVNSDFSLCCGKGKYVVDPLLEIPELIANLLRRSDEESKEFRLYLRAYNSTLGFTSLGCSLDTTVTNAHVGTYSFRIHGSLYHRIGALYPGEGEKPKFAQIYIHNSGNEIRNRHAHNQYLNIIILTNLQALMHGINRFVHDFKSMVQWIAENSSSVPNASMVFRAEGTPDQRRYNAPITTTEIGVLIVGDDNLNSVGESTRDIVIRPTTGGLLQKISELNQ